MNTNSGVLALVSGAAAAIFRRHGSARGSSKVWLMSWVAVALGVLPAAANAGFTNQVNLVIPGLYNSAVAWGDYNNDGRLDFVVIGLDDNDEPVTKIFRNNGSAFVDSGIILPGVYSGAVAWADYDNDGFLDLLVVGAISLDYPYDPITRVYHNQRDGTFFDSGLALPGAYAAAVAWGDYDQDGDLDFVLTGWTETGRIARLYRNDGAGVFVDSGVALSPVSYGAVAWGDYDNDGYLDLALCGSGNSGSITRLYHNNGDGTLGLSGNNLTGVTTGTVAWGDYDNDGDLDLLVMGLTATSQVSLVFTNHGSGVLTDSGVALPGLTSSYGAWGDYDNDGYLDLVLTGDNGISPIAALYRNDGRGGFTNSGITLPGLASGAAAWADYENSGQLDLLLTGFDTNYAAAVYLGRNTSSVSNQVPAELTGLTTSLLGRDVTLSWNNGTDDHTPAVGLHYNLRLGTNSLGVQRLSAMANPTNGFRRVVRLGNGARTNAWTVKGLPDGNYSWSVQAIDTTFAGGPFAKEITFTVPSNPPTDIHVAPATVAENQPTGTAVGTLTAVDLNVDDTHTFALVAGAGSADNASFSIVTNQLKTAAIFDFEGRNSYQIRVRATDPGGLYVEKVLTIVILDINEPPQARCHDVMVTAGSGGTANPSIDNGSSDPDAGDAIALSLSPPGPYPSGSNVVKLTVTDKSGLSDSCSAIVIVSDSTPPVLVCPATLRLEAAAGQCTAPLNYAAVVAASDNCDPAPAITSVPPAGTQLPVGVTNVVVTATDVSGNQDSETITVSVYPSGAQIAGIEWTRREVVPEPALGAWNAIACSTSGVVIAALKNGRLDVSTDYGASWTDRESARQWQAVGCSEDGRKMVAVPYNGHIYTSTDFGTNWTARASVLNWSGVASSGSGIKLAAVVYGGQIYTSDDSGETWTPRENNRAWIAVACSAAGDVIAAVVRGGQIYVSTDSGINWTPSASSAAWNSIACSRGGDFMVAAVNGGMLYTSVDYGATWTESATSQAWTSVACSQYNLILAATDGGTLFTSTDQGQSWTAGGTTQSWTAAAVSPAGELLFAVANNSHIYSSRDAGANWEISDTARLWQSLAFSADGTAWIASVSGGQLYTSTDSGTNWVARETNRNWSAVASSADGTKLLAAVNGGQLFTSSDAGANWTPRQTNRNWRAVASSADGTRLAAAVGSGQIFLSADSGKSWSPSAAATNWSSLACSADGTRLVAGAFGGQIGISTNSGLTWVLRESSRNWTDVACSADGAEIVAVAAGAQIYISLDAGATWLPSETNRQWSAVVCSSDGSKLAAADGDGGQVYLSTDAGQTWTPRGPTRLWQALACSSDGMRLGGGIRGGPLYSSLPTILPPAAPVILDATNRVVGASSPAGAVVMFNISATNQCQPNVPVTCIPPSGSTFGFGTNRVICQAVDAFGVRVTNDFTVTVVLRPQQAGWGQALALDGIDDRASVTNLSFTNISFTIELWAKRARNATWEALAAQGTSIPGKGFYLAFDDSDRAVFSFCTGDLASTNACADSAWHHLAATYDRTNGRCLYLDGILVASDTNTFAYSGTGPFWLGTAPWQSDEAFQGWMDDVRVWGLARSQAQIQSDMLHPLTGMVPGLLAYWSFDLEPGNLIHDLTLAGHNASLLGSPGRPTSTVPPWGYALSFDGTNGSVLVTTPTLASNYTVAAWVFLRSGGSLAAPVGIMNATNCGGSVDLLVESLTASSQDPQYLQLSRCGVFVGMPSTMPVPTNTWVHLAVAVTPDKQVRYFLNGLPAGVWDASALDVSLGSGFALADNSTHQFHGMLDEVQVWGRALTSAEIQAGLGQPLFSAPPDLVAHWSLDEGAGVTVFDSTPGLLDGTVVPGPTWVVSTVGRLPTVTTLLPVGVFSTGTNAVATLQGLVKPNLAASTAWFEWGMTTNYNHRTAGINVDSGVAVVACTQALTGLSAGQTYHYRLVAENAFGKTVGADRSFAPLLFTLLGTEPLLSQYQNNFDDPGFSVVNPADLQLGAQAIASGHWHVLALLPDGSVRGWGNNDVGQLNIPSAAVNIVQIAAGSSNSLALTTQGQVLAWGRNDLGQGAAPASATNMLAIAAGNFHNLALRNDGTVLAWGRNNSGQTNVPAGLTNVVKIAAGGLHNLALKADGSVITWGDNFYNQTNTPINVSNVLAVAAGAYHSLALCSDGSLAAWGRTYEGQVSIPNGLTNVIAVAAGANHSLALRADHTVAAWGNNNHGQTVVPAGLSNVVAIAGGYWHSVALRDDGSVVVWGDNTYGQTQGVNVVISGAVNTNMLGMNHLDYAITNAFGWGAVASRNVRVGDHPLLSAQPVVNVTSGTVALRSLVNPNGIETRAWFEWGATSTYTDMTVGTNMGNGFDSTLCAITVPDLVPKATYHYRMAASNLFGVVYGPDAQFIVASTDASLASLRVASLGMSPVELAVLGLNEAELAPAFDSDVLQYATRLPNVVGHLTVTPVSTDTNANIRVRVNGAGFDSIASATASRPLYLVPGTNLVEVEVTAQDGVTRRTYAMTVVRQPPPGALVGPSFPPPLGVNFNQSGNNNDDQGGRTAGKTWTFWDAPLAAQTLLFWGATNNGVKLSFNDAVYDANEILTYSPALSDLASGTVVWSGRTTTPPPVANIFTRFVLTVTNIATGAPVPLLDAAGLGLPSNIGGVALVTPGLTWKATLRFQASLATNGPYEASLLLFERVVATNIPGALAYSSFAAGFYHLNFLPTLTANQPLAVDQGMAAVITSGLLAASDFETGPGVLTFTVAPQGQGGPPRNGSLTLAGTNLVAGSTFTQSDLNANRLAYVHSGNCETQDDFTFNVTDQNGGATPTGEHTTFTFHISIAQPNLPVLAVDGSGSTGLQQPYHGVLSATNGDCTPQTLSFRLLTAPTRGSITLDNTNNGAFTYTPFAGREGVDSFKFQVNDGFVDSLNPGTFTMIVSNQRPVAVSASVTTRENLAVGGSLPGMDSDLPAQTLSFALVVNSTKGTVALTNPATGGFIYTPNHGAIGSDTFSFTVSDGLLTSLAAAFSVNIRPNVEEGDLLISDAGAGQIVLVDSAGAQGIVSAGGLITDPRGLAYEPSGSILLMDGGNGLLRIDPVSGTQSMVAALTNFSTKPLGPYGIALEPAGTVLVADGFSGVLRVNPNTGVTTTLAVSNQFVVPVSIALSPSGDAFVGDLSAAMELPSRVVHVNGASGAQSLLSSGQNLMVPTAIAMESSGNLVVAEAPSLFGAGIDQVLRINSTSGTQTVLTTSSFLNKPLGIAVATNGTIFVANGGSGTVITIDPVSGSQSLFSSGGPLVQPSGLAIVHGTTINRSSAIKLVSGRAEIRCAGVSGQVYALERSTNFTTWLQITNVAAGQDGAILLIDLHPPTGKAFYRLRLLGQNPMLNRFTRIQSINGAMQLQFQGLAGLSYALERSTNLTTWLQITNVAAGQDGFVPFLDPDPPRAKSFYRVHLP